MNLYHAFYQQVLKEPEHPAILEEEGCWSYGQLDQMAVLASRSIPEDSAFVGVVLEHSIWMIAVILGILKAGAAYVPAEVDFPLERTRFMMQESGVSVIVTSYACADRFSGFPLVFVEDLMEKWRQNNTTAALHPMGSPAQQYLQKGGEHGFAHCRKDHLPSDFCHTEYMGANERALMWMTSSHEDWSDQPAYVLYTSGSTGVPKGVVVSHANVLHYVQAFYDEFHPQAGDVMLQYSVCSFDIFVEEVFTTLLCGAALYIPNEQIHDNLPLLLEQCQVHHVTEISGFPYLLKEMDAYELPEDIRLLISGGDVLRASYISHLIKKTRIYNTYGPSETTVCASYFECRPGTELPDGTFPIGRPVTGVSIEILNENQQPAASGEIGEICIFGEGVSKGYLDASKNTMFTEYQGQRMYRSGDLGCVLPDGQLAFFGRMDEQVMIWGKRVEPKEVESVLCRCQGVASAVVTAFQDPEHLHHLIAYIQPAGKNIPEIEALKQEMQSALTAFMIPETFVFVEEIPLSERGKPDLRKLTEMNPQSCRQQA